MFEPTGDDKVRITTSTWEGERVILADQALEVVALGKVLYLVRAPRRAEYLNVDETGMTDAGYGPATAR